MTTHQEIAQVLDQSADWLESNQLVKGLFFDTMPDPEATPTGGCIRGAIYLAADNKMAAWNGDESKLSVAAQRAVLEYLKPKLLSIGAKESDFESSWAYSLVALWNNMPWVTQEEVVASLRAAAVIERCKAQEPVPA